MNLIFDKRYVYGKLSLTLNSTIVITEILASKELINEPLDLTFGRNDPTHIMKTNEYPFKIGDHVKWNSEAGYVSGKIIKIHITDFDYKGYTHHATKEDPQYAIKSDKTDHVAVHKGKALTILKA